MRFSRFLASIAVPPWVPLLLARCNVGLFFSISGYNKLFIAANKTAMLATMHEAGIPFPEFSAVLVASLEFIFGAALVLGIGTRLASLTLLAIVIVATWTDGIKKIPAGLGPLDWYDWFLYLPEVLYAILLFWLVVAGAGSYAMEKYIKRWLVRQ